ncbi:c-type cytochrome [Luteibacter jiangsuensis]|uniref:C-type cytochrome n=1 Tax=Luteibacter jiangsuensis TaxID=637577 RepID=A0ABX0Q4E4_9GAMM|nr:c-type cytochrome [Luteibacter jiangsuensis]
MTGAARVSLSNRCFLALFALVAGALAPPAARAGDASAGKDVFKTECAECHAVAEGRNKKGPSLFGIVGRKAGSVSDYDYSDALKHSPWTWTTEQLHTYLSQPAKKANPGTKMKYDGLDDAKDLDNLISYLETLH